jgi:mono/diheme cytochrome c family protein
MVTRILLVLMVLTVSASGADAQQPKIEKGPIARTPPTMPSVMFQTYCAVCHGKDAKGGGPAAPALTKAPADLTRIAARNGGTFPDTRVRRFIEGLDEVAAHGTRDMPMWGGLFRSLDQNTAALRVVALSDYLKTLQVK